MFIRRKPILLVLLICSLTVGCVPAQDDSPGEPKNAPLPRNDGSEREGRVIARLEQMNQKLETTVDDLVTKNADLRAEKDDIAKELKRLNAREVEAVKPATPVAGAPELEALPTVGSIAPSSEVALSPSTVVYGAPPIYVPPSQCVVVHPGVYTPVTVFIVPADPPRCRIFGRIFGRCR